MAYTKTVWASGDTVTSAKLNKIENELESLSNGGAMGGSLLVTISEAESGGERGAVTTYVLDKTYNEIVAAFSNGILPVGIMHETQTYTPDIIIDMGTRTAVTVADYYSYCPFLYVGFWPYDNSNPTENPVYSAGFKILGNGETEFYSLSPDGQMTTDEPTLASPKSAEPDTKSTPDEDDK